MNIQPRTCAAGHNTSGGFKQKIVHILKKA